MKPLLLISVLAVGQVVFASTTAELEISSGATTIIITDNEAGVDLNPAPGAILYTNSNFAGWNISFVGASSNSPNVLPFGIDIGGLAANCDAGFTCAGIAFIFSDINFTQKTSTFVSTYSATITGAGAALTSQGAYDGTSNTLFGGSGVAIGPKIILTSSGAGSTTGGSAPPSPYSLSIDDILTGGSGVAYSFDGAVSGVPEPTSILMLGGALVLACGAIRRKIHN